MRVKICGITTLEDALNAIKCGADALGFVFYEKSPRYISPEIAKQIISKLPPFVEKVGLFVDCDALHVNSTCKDCKLTLAQIHFEADEAFFEALQVPYIKVVRASKKEDVLRFSDEYRLVDAMVQSYGGEGKRIDLRWFDGVDCSKIILAGGLDAQNILQVKPYGFYGVDVSSGVEKSKGVKDSDKVALFIQRVKA
ncbi:MAG: phosphoribosylanthranilate isomerase [Sulfurospirillaceae bacterium]|nr:phosphoribosylanthranilate isomerase [Sulfurospirillaceae bacterium]